MAMNSDTVLRIKAEVQGENNIRRLGGSLRGLQGQARGAAMSFTALKGAVAGFGAAIAGSAIVGGLGAIVKRSIDAGDELFNLQAKTGIAASALIGLGNAAKLADVDQATLGKSLTRLSVNLVKAAEGNDGLAQKFKALGVSVKDANGQVVPADRALKQIADRFADMPDGAQKAAAAVALFGKSGADLIPLLNEGAAAMEKFTYKVGDDFAARSDLFNDTITTLGIQAQGFGLELTDALLPALQSILEVFGDLFDTKQDWTALFQVITGGLRVVATVVYATIKLVDQLIKAVVYSFDAIGKALQGDFSGAGRAISQGFGAGLEQAKRDFEQIGKIWTDAPSPGTGRRTGGRGMDAGAPDEGGRSAESEARRAAAQASRAASEQERLLERRQDLTRKAIDLQQQLQNSIADVAAAYAGVGASPTDQLFLERNEAITEDDRRVKELTRTVVELEQEINAAGGSLDVKPFADLIDRLSAANVALADQTYQQGFSDYWASQAEGIRDATAAAWEFARAQQYNADITGGLRDGIGSYVESIGTMREGMAQLAQSGIQGVEDAIFSLVTTGKVNFREFAADILKQTTRLIIQQLILKTVMQAIGAIGGGGGGGIGASTQFNASGVNFNPVAFSAPSFAGGGFTGSGARSGGLDGQGGFMAMLHPRESVIDHTMQGGMRSGSSTSVVVNVDASGNSRVQGDGGQAEQLGRVVSQAVQAELIRQKRPGGILA
jgi:lambda family phage tail tape measure protein